jgi:hypothetical protein
MPEHDSRDESGPVVPLSSEEWRYVSLIAVHVGSLTPLLEGRPDYHSFVKQMLTEAHAKGLDPRRIYRAAAILPPAIAARMPAWYEVEPAALSSTSSNPQAEDPSEE